MHTLASALLLTLMFKECVLPLDAQADLLEIEKGISRAIVDRDVAFVERVFAPEFVYTGVRGEVKSRADLIDELKAGELSFRRLTFSDVRVQIYGEAAVVTGLATTEGKSKQGEIRGRFRYTRVYMHKDGAWRLVAFQGTPVVDSN